MAGDWMKVELDLPDKPEVHYIAGATNLEPDAVVGKLLRVWAWFDKHTHDGNAVGVTYALVDRVAGVTGFGEAMAFAGWLEQHDKTLSMPKFDRHTSNSAKKRALGTARQSRKRNAVVTPEALPREEKRREEKRVVQPHGADAPDWLPPEFKEFEQHRREKRATLTPTARAGCIRKLDRWKAEGHDVVAILRYSIDNGYTGLIDPNERGKGNGGARKGVTAGNIAAAQEWVRREEEKDRENRGP